MRAQRSRRVDDIIQARLAFALAAGCVVMLLFCSSNPVNMTQPVGAPPAQGMSSVSDGDALRPAAEAGDAVGSDSSGPGPVPSDAAAGPGADVSPIPSPNDATMPDSDAATADLDGAVDSANLPGITLFLAGDSTVSPYGSASAQQGWGEHLFQFFVSKVMVDNQAFAGRSIKTFMYDDAAETVIASHWNNIRNGLKPGDFVMIEFGINDSSVGSPRFVAIPDFTRLLGVMADTIIAKHATPIFVTPSALQYWVNGVETNAREQPYADAMKQVATQKNLMVDDLNARSVEYLNMIGQTAAAQIYINNDKAHFTLQGATEMAKLVTRELLRIASPLGAYVK